MKFKKNELEKKRKELAKEVAELERQEQKLKEQKKAEQAEKDRLTLESYEKQCQELKAEVRDPQYDLLIEKLQELQNVYQNLQNVRTQHKQIAKQASEASVRLGKGRISTDSWGLTVKSDKKVIDLGFASTFKDFLRRLADIVEHEKKLVA